MMETPKAGRLFGVGLGPGDPELITLKALRIIRQVQVVAYPTAKHGQSNARSILEGELVRDQIELPMVYPVTTEISDHPGGYEVELSQFYDQMAEQIAAHLDQGRDVAILCEGDPFFYGSYMYLHDRLAKRFTTEVVPGIPSFMAAAARLGTPLVRRDSELTILPGTLPEEQLASRLGASGAFAIMKLGRNFPKVKNALVRAGVADKSLYIERATMTSERVIAWNEVDGEAVPYFSLILVPDSHPRTERILHSRPGNLCVVGLGPGQSDWITPEAQRSLREATDLVGYQPYLDRVPARTGQQRHGSDNKVEVERARHALALAEAGRRVCIVSSGDPGIFAMASALLEAVEHGPAAWRALDIKVIPGLSAMQAAASRVGAPLGHDFCVLSLSDRLKPWDAIATRLHAVGSADFALAIYNPVSSERTWQLAEARSIIAEYRTPDTPVVLARAVGRPGESIRITDLGSLDPAIVDMQTVVLIGSSTTRSMGMSDGRRVVYTPRSYGGPR
jgi:precorrin-2 C20-methyltransferase / precorrin-3B C17-methyltransferase